MSFTKQVRDGKVAQPTQRRFSRVAWEAAFQATPSPTVQDERLYVAGLWFESRFVEARSAFDTHALSGVAPVDILRALTGEMNRTCVMLSSLEPVPNDADTIVNEALLQTELDISPITTPMTPDEIIIADVDGSRLLLEHYLQQLGKESAPEEKEVGTEFVDRLSRMVVVSQLIDQLQQMWADVLWNGWFLEQGDDWHRLHPPDDAYARGWAVSDYRHRSLTLQFASLAGHGWRRLSPNARSSIREPHVRVSGSGKRRKIDGNVRQVELDHVSVWNARRIAVEDFYFPEMFLEPFPDASELTLARLLDAWEVLVALCNAFLGRLPKDQAIKRMATLRQYCITVSTSELIRLWRSCLPGMSITQARALLEFFTFRSARSDEIWAKPLIPLGKEAILVVMSPILFGNLMRTTGLWMRLGGLNLTQRGPAFEEYVRSSLADSLRKNGKLGASGVYPRALTVPNENEEIDLVLWVGGSVVVAEIKCMLFPATSMEQHNYMQTIDFASEQIARKTEAFGRNGTGVAKVLREAGMIKPVERIIPIVLLNHPLGAGLRVREIPVVDLLILDRYLADGTLEWGVSVDQDGITNVGRTDLLYGDADEAASNLEEYLRNPPQVRFLEPWIALDWRPDLRLSASSSVGAVGRYVVRLPVGDSALRMAPQR